MPWHVKTIDGYSGSEAEDNARMIYGILSSRGWTLNAVCGMLGNIGAESGYNPWRWQDDDILSSTSELLNSRKHGYGLVQFTPANKYVKNATSFSGYGPNFSDKTGNTLDGQAQVYYIDEHADYYPSSYSSMTYANYKKSTLNAGTLAKIWLHNYERPGDASTSVENARASTAEYWFGTLGGSTSPTVTYNITIQVEGNGTATASADNASEGTTITLTATPNEGDTFTEWEVVSGNITISNNTFTMPAEDVIIKAVFTGETPQPEPETKKKSKWIYYMRPAWTTIKR